MEERFKLRGEVIGLPNQDYRGIEFRTIRDVTRGAVFQLLAESYLGWSERDDHLEDWRSADQEFFDMPATAGACAAFTFLGDQLAGFTSWDPRQFPVALIGHNCVRPAYRKRGIGKAQLQHTLGMLAEKRFRRVCVTTGDSDFFLPARRMYASCGFQEAARKSPGPAQVMGTVEYRLDLGSVLGNGVKQGVG